jgi:hypothetical protein
MNRFSITLAAALLAPVAAHADDGQWMDTRHHIALDNLPNSSEPIAAPIRCNTPLTPP